MVVEICGWLTREAWKNEVGGLKRELSISSVGGPVQKQSPKGQRGQVDAWSREAQGNSDESEGILGSIHLSEWTFCIHGETPFVGHGSQSAKMALSLISSI